MSDETPDKPKYKRLTEAEWASASADFELGKYTATQLARIYGVSRQAMSEGLKARGKVYGIRSKVVEEAAINAAKTDEARRVEEIQAMREKQRKLIETTQQIAAKYMMDAVRDAIPISQKRKDIATLKDLMAIFSRGRSELWEIYNLNNDENAGEELPELVVSEYTPEELVIIQRQMGGLPDMEDTLAQLERHAKEEGQGDDPLAGLLDEDE